MNPVLFIDNAVDVTPVGGRVIIALDSIGAQVRLSLSRQQIEKLAFLIARATTEMDARPSCVIKFPKKKVKR